MLFVDQGDGQEAWGNYRIEDSKIYVTELHFRYLADEDPIRDNMELAYVFTVMDEDHLMIDPGFYNVQAGDIFIRAASKEK